MFLVFLVMKLAEIGAVATWSWWWVTAPLWGPALLALGIGGIYLLFAGLVWVLDRVNSGPPRGRS